MLAVGNILILIGFIKLISGEYSALFCATFYAIITFIFRLMVGIEFADAFTAALIYFVTSLLYFFLLKKTQHYPLFWWIILVGGLLIGLI